MFMPSLVRPLPMVPKCEMTEPLTGHRNFVLRYLETGFALLRELWAVFFVVVLAEEDDFQLQRLGVVLGVAALYEAVSVLLRLPGSTSRWPMARV